MSVDNYTNNNLGQSIQEYRPTKICGRQSLKILKGYGLLQADHIPSNFLKDVFHKFCLVHS